MAMPHCDIRITSAHLVMTSLILMTSTTAAFVGEIWLYVVGRHSISYETVFRFRFRFSKV